MGEKGISTGFCRGKEQRKSLWLLSIRTPRVASTSLIVVFTPHKSFSEITSSVSMREAGAAK